MTLRKKLVLVALSIFIPVAGLMQAAPVSAAEPSAGHIIDDAIFDNKNSMSEAQIQNFINAFPASCLLPQNYPGGLSPVTFDEPIDYFNYGNDTSPARIIWKVSQLYGLNPQVILATLEKEQNLVTGNAGCAVWRYNSAVGYNCPDGSENALKDYPNIGIYDTCVAKESNAGFARQVNHASWQFKFDKERAYGNVYWGDEGDWEVTYVGRMTQGSRKRIYYGQSAYYDGYTTIDGQSIYLSNGATAALYNFTPHFNSFGTIFSKWFGSPRLSDYQWSPDSQASYSDQNKTTPLNLNDVVAGSRAYLTVRVKNTGVATWYKGSTNLATSQPNDRWSAVYDSSWLSQNRVTSMQEDSVSPGQFATFNFWINIPAPGSYKEYFNVVAEGITWMNDNGLYFQINSQPARYSWQPHDQKAYSDSARTQSLNASQVKVGDRVYARVSVRNSGNVSWHKGRINLATSQPNDRWSALHGGQWLSVNRVTSFKEDVVKPGDLATFDFSMTMPSTGYKKEYFNLVAEGITWMPDLGMYYDFNVQPTTYSWQPHSQKAFTDETKSTETALTGTTSGKRYYLQVKVRNSGNTVWYKNAVNLGTSLPKDRISAFRDGSWSSGNRASTLVEEQVNPGDIATFEFWVTAPQFSGEKREYFNLVAEGITWMPDLGMYYGFYN